MAGITLMITFIFIAIIVGINSETFDWGGYHVIRETSFKGDEKNFTQSLTRTVEGIETVDRTVELTNNMTNRKISTDHSTTTTKDSVVTFDRTLEQFDFDSNLVVHDHFFNTSNGDTVTTGRNCTSLSGHDKKIKYVEVTDVKNGYRSIHFTTEHSRAKGHKNITRISLVHRKNGMKEIYDNVNVYSDEKLRFVDNSVAFINNSEYTVDCSVTKFFSDGSDIERQLATFHAQNLTTVVTNNTVINLSTKFTKNNHFTVMLDDKGGINITYIDKEVYPDGKEVFQSRNAKFDASKKCYSIDGTCESKDIVRNMKMDAASRILQSTYKFNELKTIEETAKKEFQDLMERKYNFDNFDRFCNILN